jgi:PHD/YefM family antitoxin component YafN of YafNO toxin-antitoxin module/Asp-tRNA(Asn)/Glu-tRNA(Gln) amidotransferase C subunit
VQAGSDQFVITNRGKPQAVLLGYGEYKGLLAAVELLNHPHDLAHLREGLAQSEQLSFEEIKENLQRRKTPQGHLKPAATAAARIEATPEESFGKKLDEINEYLKRIVERLGEGEPTASQAEAQAASAKTEKDWGPFREDQFYPLADFAVRQALAQAKAKRVAPGSGPAWPLRKR